MRRRFAVERQKQQAQAAAQLAYSRDNKRIDIAANIGTALEAPGAFANGAEGVGLFRTEKCCIWIVTARRTSRSNLKPTSRCYWQRATSRLSSAQWTSEAIKAFLI
ncbi:putative PEP-binding protein [Escherichia coli]